MLTMHKTFVMMLFCYSDPFSFFVPGLVEQLAIHQNFIVFWTGIALFFCSPISCTQVQVLS